MTIYQINNNEIIAIEETSFAEQGLKERTDLQRLLKHQIEIISPNTLIFSEEFGEWDESRRRIDLLGVDKTANIVVIELKRTEGVGHMELQAIRYAAMVSTMTFERVVEIFSKYLYDNNLAGDAREIILSFLEWDEADEDQFGQDVHIVLASAEFSKELTTAVMWLNERSLDIRCVRIKPYKDGERTLLDVQTVIPLPEVEAYQVKIKEKKQRERQSRDGTKDRGLYSIIYGGNLVVSGFKKSDIGLNTILVLNDSDLIGDEIFKVLREDKSCNFLLLKTKEEVTENEKKYRKYRVHKEPEFFFKNTGYYVARNWEIGNVQGFVDKMKSLFSELDYEIYED